jgi:uncharacterized membrane protein
MSKKRGMSKQQRLYYEYQNKEKVRQELQEIAKQSNDFERTRSAFTTSDPHKSSFYH